MEQRTDITELIPKALGNYWLILFGGVGVVTGLEFAYRQLPVWAEKFGEANLAPLDVTSSGGILAWYLSTMFLLAAGVSLINSRLGKKYNDPAKGDVWFWAAFALVLLSLDTQVRFRETLRVLLVHATGTPLYQDGTVWWLVAYSFVFGLIAIRLLQDMWAYVPSFFLFSLTLLGTVASQLIKIDAVHLSWAAADVIVLHTALEACAVLFLFLSFLLFGRRQVFRDPQVALLWFAKVWKQEFPNKKQATVVPTAPSVFPKPAPMSDSTSEMKSAQATGSRPALQKSGNDDFTLLNAS